MANFDVKGKYVVIAGASRGLGMALGLELAAKGAHILLLARGQEGLEKAQKEMLAARQEATQTIVYQCVDLTKPAECQLP